MPVVLILFFLSSAVAQTCGTVENFRISNRTNQTCFSVSESCTVATTQISNLDQTIASLLASIQDLTRRVALLEEPLEHRPTTWTELATIVSDLKSRRTTPNLLTIYLPPTLSASSPITFEYDGQIALQGPCSILYTGAQPNIWIFRGGRVKIREIFLTANSITAYMIWAASATLSIEDSTLSSTIGGGIFVLQASTLTANNITIITPAFTSIWVDQSYSKITNLITKGAIQFWSSVALVQFGDVTGHNSGTALLASNSQVVTGSLNLTGTPHLLGERQAFIRAGVTNFRGSTAQNILVLVSGSVCVIEDSNTFSRQHRFLVYETSTLIAPAVPVSQCVYTTNSLVLTLNGTFTAT